MGTLDTRTLLEHAELLKLAVEDIRREIQYRDAGTREYISLQISPVNKTLEALAAGQASTNNRLAKIERKRSNLKTIAAASAGAGSVVTFIVQNLPKVLAIIGLHH